MTPPCHRADSNAAETVPEPVALRAKRLISQAREHGFSHCGSVSAKRLVIRPEVRSMCAVDRCLSFNRSWMCPPACGSLESFETAFAERSICVIVQTAAPLEDEFDIEGMMAAESAHKERFESLVRALPDACGSDSFESGIHPLPLSAGACTLCPRCSYPDAPCRYPKHAMASMEAAGLLVSDVCEAAGLPYYHGKGAIAFTSCILI